LQCPAVHRSTAVCGDPCRTRARRPMGCAQERRTGVSRARAEIADRRALLAARAELDRARVTLAVHDVKAIVFPPPGAAPGGIVRTAAALLARLIGPALGMYPFRRWLRIAPWALAA